MFISQVEVSSSVTTLVWSEGSEYVYGINGTSDDADVSNALCVIMCKQTKAT